MIQKSMNLKKFSTSVIITIIIKFFAVAIGLYTARWTISYISKGDLADFNTILGLATTIVGVINLGIPSIIQRHYTNTKTPENDGDFWITMTYLRMISYPIGVLLCILLMPITGINNIALTIASYTMLFILVADLNFRSITDAKGNSWQYSVSDFIGKVFLAVLLFVFSRVSTNINSVYIFISISMMTYTLTLIVDSIWQKKYYTFGSFDINIIKNSYKSLIYFTLINTLIALYSNTDKIFLKRYGFDDGVINGYANAYKLFDISIIVVGLATPMIASFAKKRIDDINMGKMETWVKQNIFFAFPRIGIKKTIFSTYLLINIAIGSLTSIGLFLIGPFIIRFIDVSNKYPLVFDILPILSLGVIPLSIVLFLGYMIVFYGGEKYELLNYIITSFLGLILYFWLIPIYGGIGAAFATVCIFGIDMTTKIVLIQKQKIFA